MLGWHWRRLLVNVRPDLLPGLLSLYSLLLERDLTNRGMVGGMSNGMHVVSGVMGKWL